MKRRDFLAAGAGGLCIGVALPGVRRSPQQSAALEPSAYLRISPDDTVTIWVTKLEMGQGVRTLLPMIIAEELDADWTRIHVEQAWPGGKFRGINLHTGGSFSTPGSYRTLRLAGATAREMLIAAAAAQWGVAPDTCRADLGNVVHAGTSRRLSFGALATAASQLPVPSAPALKNPADFQLLGKPMRRVDGPAIVTGRAQYGLDVHVPGMVYASIERAPSFGATIVRFDASRALAMPGVRRVVRVDAGIHPGLAVIADDTWSAMRAREALRIEWTPARIDFDSDRFIAAMPEAWSGRLFPVRSEGDAATALASASSRLSATYTFPFQAHAPMETMNCTALVRGGRVEVWVPTQTDERSLQQITKVTGIPAERITMHCTLMGGGFGRRLFADYVAEAVQLSQAVDAPVQVLWTRQDDMRHGYFEPATANRFTAGLSSDGALVALDHETTSSDLTIYDMHGGRNIWDGSPAAAKADDSYASDQSPWGAYDNPYEIPHLRVRCADVTSPVPTGPWRAVEYPSTVFARESFLDEVAHLAGKDPLALRLELLPRNVKLVTPYRINRERLANVLETARVRSDWATPLAPDERNFVGRGVAASMYHGGSYIAMVAEVSVAKDWSEILVRQIVTVVDCGIALNPLGLEGQTESAITWGLSATLHGMMNFKGGAAVQSSYLDFEVMRIDRMPRLETVIVNSGAAPGGYGEHPVPLVANAVFNACGKRIRDLPITPGKLALA